MPRTLRIVMDNNLLRNPGADLVEVLLDVPFALAIVGELTRSLAERPPDKNRLCLLLKEVHVQEHHEEWRPLGTPAAGQGCPADCDADE